jgi:hypothetical protein
MRRVRMRTKHFLNRYARGATLDRPAGDDAGYDNGGIGCRLGVGFYGSALAGLSGYCPAAVSSRRIGVIAE